jgi:UDP-N-acetylmuramyl pentapeptide phosphotransferase/UDP-N-acetylglucosamine-1-phosphate transferase
MKNYIAISGSIFAIVAFAHLLRIIDGWDGIVNGQAVPMTISYMAFVATGLLAVWAFRAK